ncbi:hypothetical protein NESM_000547200 [Novymonas esmeraldas]|uniref:Uncharacterized protein n=1 Tax=Novymonas esmeraldas TaxID=1808958 RepID=A0AAW0EPM9_9TRYP
MAGVPLPNSTPPCPPVAENRSGAIDDSTATAVGETLVVDAHRRHYLTVLPRYSCATADDYRRVLAWRIVLCVLTVVVLVLSVVGQVVPYVSRTCDRYGRCINTYDGTIKYGEWTETNSWTMYSIGLFPLSIVASCVAGVLVALTITFACLWSSDESQRCAEAAMNRRVLRLYGRVRGDTHVDQLSDFPYANRCVTNTGLVEHVPLEVREAARAKRDRDVGIAIFSLYIVYFGLDLTMVMFMFTTVPTSSYSYYNYYYSEDVGVQGAGVVVCTIALIIAVLAFVLVAIPQATDLSLCHPRQVTRCFLMLVHEDGDAIEDTALVAAARLLVERHDAVFSQRRHGAVGHPGESHVVFPEHPLQRHPAPRVDDEEMGAVRSGTESGSRGDYCYTSAL